MNNPWTKKNPWMSMWLSAAHQVGNTALAQTRAQAQAQIKRTAQQGMHDAMSMWTGWMFPTSASPHPPPPARRKASTPRAKKRR